MMLENIPYFMHDFSIYIKKCTVKMVFFSNNERVVIILTYFSMVTLYAIGRIISHG